MTQLRLDLEPRYVVVLCTDTAGNQWRHRVPEHLAQQQCRELEALWDDVKATVEE